MTNPCCSCGQMSNNRNCTMCMDCWLDVINAAYREHARRQKQKNSCKICKRNIWHARVTESESAVEYCIICANGIENLKRQAIAWKMQNE